MIKSKIHLRADSANGAHTKITVFCNGANCGQLTMTEEEATFFHHTVMTSTYPKFREVISSGVWDKKGG